MWTRTGLFAADLIAATPVGDASALDLEQVSHLDPHVPEIGLTESSGLAVGPDGRAFWIVSNSAQTVFRIDEHGDLERYIGDDGRLNDLEGVTLDIAQNHNLLLVSEPDAAIVAVSLDPPY